MKFWKHSVILNNIDVSDNTKFNSNVSIYNKLRTKNLLSDVSTNKVCINNQNLDPSYNLHISGDTNIIGNLTVNGNVTIIDTVQETSEQLIINNNGTGPAIIINQIGAQPIIDFQDDSETPLDYDYFVTEIYRIIIFFQKLKKA